MKHKLHKIVQAFVWVLQHSSFGPLVLLQRWSPEFPELFVLFCACSLSVPACARTHLRAESLYSWPSNRSLDIDDDAKLELAFDVRPRIICPSGGLPR